MNIYKFLITIAVGLAFIIFALRERIMQFLTGVTEDNYTETVSKDEIGDAVRNFEASKLI